MTSRNTTTAPRPLRWGSGADEYATRNFVPSLRQKQSSSTRTVSPVARGRSIGHSSSGNGVPSQWWWWIVGWLTCPSSSSSS